MSRRDAITLASRTLAVLMSVWALVEITYMPRVVLSFLRYADGARGPESVQYFHRYYLIELGFLVTRIFGYSLVARWLFKGGPEIEQLLLPAVETPTSPQ